MNKKILFVGGVVVAFSILGIPVWSKLRQSEAGVCALTGATLSDAQLRKEVIANLAKNQQDIVRHQDAEYLPGAINFKVADKISDEEIAETVYFLKDENDSFAKHFKFRTESQNTEFLEEPFVLLTYEYGGNLTSIASRTASQNIRIVEATKKHLGNFQPSWLEKLSGYGNRYIEVTSRQFSYACCMAPNAEDSPIRKSVPIVFKKEATPGAVIASPVSARIAAVSNCGEIMTYRDKGGFSRIKWTKGE